jgi:hypothetical protein
LKLLGDAKSIDTNSPRSGFGDVSNLRRLAPHGSIIKIGRVIGRKVVVWSHILRTGGDALRQFFIL